MTTPGKLDTSWHDRAACRGMDTAVWFDAEDVDRAVAICAGCPVRAQCHGYALAAGEQFGIWGGDTSRLRATSHRASALKAATPDRIVGELRAHGQRWVMPHALAEILGLEANTVQKHLSRLMQRGAPIERHPRGGAYRVKEAAE